MKKYIRTNDGIYKARQCYPEETLFENVTYVYRHEFVKNKDIIAQADTIEELCDEFVYDLYGKHFKCYYSPKTKTWVDSDGGVDLHKEFVKTIKGAIWTNKGLQFVARMNSEGVLELL